LGIFANRASLTLDGWPKRIFLHTQTHTILDTHRPRQFAPKSPSAFEQKTAADSLDDRFRFRGDDLLCEPGRSLIVTGIGNNPRANIAKKNRRRRLACTGTPRNSSTSRRGEPTAIWAMTHGDRSSWLRSRTRATVPETWQSDRYLASLFHPR